jgi:hypothetical protein
MSFDLFRIRHTVNTKRNFLVGRINPLAGYVQHPSSSLKYSEWYPVAQDLLFK